MKSLSDNLHRRLTLSKYLFRQARRILQQSEPYSRGLATSLLHDSVEVFLRVLTERFKIEVPRRENFLQLFDNVRKSIDCVGEHSAAIKRLNTARVGFKHEGLDVGATDVEAFLANVEAFLSEVCKEELRVDFATLSLVNAIGHRRTQNWLEKAREALRSEHYRGRRTDGPDGDGAAGCAHDLDPRARGVGGPFRVRPEAYPVLPS